MQYLQHLMTSASVPFALNSLLETAFAPVSHDLDELSHRLPSYLPVHSASARLISEHLFGAGGKRIRPALLMMCARLFEKPSEHYFPMAAVCEFVHTASLLHDDVVDNSTLRRNRPTANSVWGDESAVLVGDLIYARASELMADTGKLAIVRSFAEAIRLMSEGELLQLENIFDAALSEDRYLDVVFKKTAVLIAAACQASAILADAPQTQIEALAVYGTSVGMTFQIVDDCLDYVNASDKLGKPVLADLSQGKVTLPLIHLLRDASESEKEFLGELFKKTSHTPEENQRVQDLMMKHGSVDSALKLAQSYSTKAQGALGIFPVSQARQDLEAIVGYLMLRDC